MLTENITPNSFVERTKTFSISDYLTNFSPNKIKIQNVEFVNALDFSPNEIKTRNVDYVNAFALSVCCEAHSTSELIGQMRHSLISGVGY